MIWCFQKLDLGLNKINFQFGNILLIYTQQYGDVGKNGHFVNYTKSCELLWFCDEITKKLQPC